MAVVMALYGVLTLLLNVPPFTVGVPLSMVLLNASVGVAMLLVAWGLFALRPWAWIVTLGVEIINGLFALAAMANMPRSLGPWLTFAVSGIVVFYLTRANVRRAFLIPDSRMIPPGMGPV